MLIDDDLQNFLDALKASEDSAVIPAQPVSILANDSGLFPPEIWRLVCSLQIAASAGGISQIAPIAAQIILDDIKGERCIPLSELSKWAQAIAWARMQPQLANLTTLTPSLGREREVIVGNACHRIRSKGYNITIGAYGPRIEEPFRRQIIQGAENLVSLIGGLETINQVIRFLNDAKLHHDGMWLFGEQIPNLYDAKRPMLPVGWIFSMGLRHLSSKGIAKKPEVAWKSLTDLAIDFAAVHDCQRYSQYGGINLHPTQAHRAFADSTLWRELFTLPQMPPKALRQILDVLEGVLTADDQAKLGFSARQLFKELTKLLGWSPSNQSVLHTRATIAKELPLLHRLTGGPQVVNTGYSDPLAVGERTQDNTLLFAYGKDQVITLPSALLAPAICQLIFEQIWGKLGKRAEDIVKETLEEVIVNACQGKASTVYGNKKYTIKKNIYEIDAATRTGDQIALIETKAKSLTSQSRSGDMFSFFNDYAESFLRMAHQLIRHEVHLRQGLTPLTIANEKVDDFRPLKIAVSPLSYGSVSDKLLSSSLLKSFVGTKLNLITPDKENQKIIDNLHKRLDSIFNYMPIVAPQRDGLPDFTVYFIDMFWLDIGQLLYILDRANTVWDAFSPIKNITFSSRDLWTEIANADRIGLTKDKWKQLN